MGGNNHEGTHEGWEEGTGGAAEHYTRNFDFNAYMRLSELIGRNNFVAFGVERTRQDLDDALRLLEVCEEVVRSNSNGGRPQ